MKDIVNFRDLGGYEGYNGKKIKKGMLYRAAHPDKLKGKSLNKFLNLGIKTIIDLRTANKKNKNIKINKNISIINLPINFNKTIRGKLKPIIFKKKQEAIIEKIYINAYASMVLEEKNHIKTIFDLISDNQNLPLLIHCRAGKDRTGFISAVILMALGVDERLITEDYLLTNKHFLPKAQKYLKKIKLFTFGLLYLGNISFIFTANEKYIKSVINTIKNEFKDINNYLKVCGITKDQLEKIKNNLLK